MRCLLKNLLLLAFFAVLPILTQAQRLDVVLTKAGTLADQVGDITSVTSLKVSGPINGTDLRCIHEMCGMDYEHNTTQGKLDSLDLSDANIVKGGKSYFKDIESDSAFYTQQDQLGTSALEGCFTLTYVVLPKTLQDVGLRAFASCPLKEICIDEANEWLTVVDGVLYTKDLKTMKGFPAERFSSSETFTAPEGLQEIPDFCMMLGVMGQVVLPSTVEVIGKQALFSCLNLYKVVLPAGLKSLAADAFVSCSNLKELQIDAGNENFTISNGVLYNKQLTTLYLFPPALEVTTFEVPSSVTEISPYAFAFNKNLITVDLPESLTTIGTGAFGGCEKLQSLSIPNKVTSLPDYLFSYCSSLTSVSLPESLEKFGAWCFDECTELTELNIPQGITTLPEGLFYDCSSLTEVSIPEGVTTIGSSAFYGCEALNSVDIPQHVSSIGTYAFMNCKALTAITVPEGVTEIPYATFMWCGALQNVILPSTLSTVGDFAFVGLEKLQTMRCDAVTPPACGNSVFYKTKDKADLYVPDNSVDAYKSDASWSIFNVLPNSSLGIQGIEKEEPGKPEYFGLNGQRRPTLQRGLNIKKSPNGKSVIILSR